MKNKPGVVSKVAIVALAFSVVCCGEEKKAPEEVAPVKPVAEKPTEPEKPAADEPPKDLPYKIFPDVGTAMRDILHRKEATVIGFGEVHQTTATTDIESSIVRFGRDIVPIIKDTTGHLVVETWVTEGNCGKEEKKVLKDVKEHTERPETTENEVVKLMKLVKELGIDPHILEVSCPDYNKLLENDGEVDYWELLGLITEGLKSKTASLVEASAATERKTSVIYGGAIHNDIKPYDELKTFSYAEALSKASDGKYLEIDLYVPEFVQDNEYMAKEAWFPLFQKLASPKNVLVIERGERSFILVFKRGVKAAPSAAKK